MRQQVYPASSWDPSNEADKAYAEFVEAWFSGASPEVEAYVETRPECAEALRARIEDFLFVTEGFQQKPIRKAEEDGANRECIPKGTILGDFEIGSLIGRGGMGVVYEAVQLSLRRKVALKILPPHLSLSMEAVRKFKREAEAGGRQRHQGIISVFDAGEFEGVHYIAQELIEGGYTLADSIDEAKQSGKPPNGYFRVVARKIAEVADALHHAHESGVIHRDVKPSNILLTREGIAKVTDFGLARVEDALALSRSGDFAGTPYYMSPEQAVSSRHKIDRRSDVFSLGVTLYEMLAFKRPFDGNTSQDVLRQILYNEPLDPRKVKNCVPVDLAVISLKAMEKQPGRRYQTALEMGDDLRRYLTGDVISAKQAGTMERARKLARRNPVTSIAAGIFVSALLFIMGYILLWAYPHAVEQTEQITRLSDVFYVNELLKSEPALWQPQPEQIRRMVRGFDELNEESYTLHYSMLLQEKTPHWLEQPARIELVEQWIRRAKEVLARLELHRQRYKQLRKIALPVEKSEEDRLRKSTPEWNQLKDLIDLRSETQDKLSVAKRGEPIPWYYGFEEHERERYIEGLKQYIANIDEQMESLEVRLRERRQWEFKDRAHLWEFKKLQELLAAYELLWKKENGLLERVLRRLEFAREKEPEHIRKYRDRWKRAIDCIADIYECPLYGGLEIRRQPGFVPVGRDPDSGLWEFVHLMTGEVPERDQAGKLVCTAASGMVFVLIPGGVFRLGAQRPSGEYPEGAPNIDPHARDDELVLDDKIIRVTIKPFLLSKFEMTSAQWFRLSGSVPDLIGYRHLRDPLLHPVTRVSWGECVRVLSDLGLRLPIESEWEYAVRAGTTTVRWTGNGKTSLSGAANIADRSFAKYFTSKPDSYEDWIDDGYFKHAPVGRFKPNAFGLHDMLGNVQELCWDTRTWFYTKGMNWEGGEPRWHGASAQIIRGGGWRTLGDLCRSACRESATRTCKNDDLGVRPAAFLR